MSIPKIHLSEFQFHKGTIKTSDVEPVLPSFVEFQFHKGTIKTADFFCAYRKLDNFNSIKVRLKHNN